MRIAVIGGGVGGLCLAQGLRQAGVDVGVYERDRSSGDRLQGYRIHVSPEGGAALKECLPEENWRRFERSCGGPGQGFGFLNERLKALLVLDDAEGEVHYSASRITLRQVLLDGLDVEFGKRFVRYETQDKGIKLHFEDGSSATCDVLVGADGRRSKVRQQYLPHAQSIHTGVVAVAGKLMLDEHDWVPEQLLIRANSIVPTAKAGMFMAKHDGLGDTDQGGVLFDNERPYLMWAYGAKDLTVHDGLDLRQEVRRRIAGWSPELQKIVELTHPDTITPWHIESSVPVEAWEASNVTVLGDAIHAMTPMGGIGANTALRDAQVLKRRLVKAYRGEIDTIEAIRGYEAEMREYGFGAVRRSLRAARQFADGSAFSRVAFKTVLRTASAVPALKRAMFAS